MERSIDEGGQVECRYGDLVLYREPPKVEIYVPQEAPGGAPLAPRKLSVTVTTDLTAEIETAGNVSVTRGRNLAAKAAGTVFTPAGVGIFLFGNAKHYTHDHRELYLILESAGEAEAIPIDPNFGAQARQFASAVNKLARTRGRPASPTLPSKQDGTTEEPANSPAARSARQRLAELDELRDAGLVLQLGQHCIWSCDPSSQPGDIALLYRAEAMRDFSHVFRVEDRDRYYHPQIAADFGGALACDCTVVAALADPITLAAVKADPVLARWPARLVGFHKGAFPIQPPEWRALVGLSSPRDRSRLRAVGGK